ncbi:MAG TPA: MFS transporter [Acidimicrobiales bacterium]|nr:MFS transporter [Acidimicrobiales bacterium]
MPESVLTVSEDHSHLHLTDAIDDVVGGPARRRVILLLGSILGLQAADTGAVGALAAPLEKAFHIGNTDIGLLVTVTTLVGCVATLPFGTVADRYSRTRLLQAVIALWAVATVASCLSVSYSMLLVTRLALGGVIAAAGPALASLFGDLVPGDERSRLWGYVLTGELVGAGLGILVAGGLGGLLGWRLAMGVLAVPAVVLAWAVRRWLPEPARAGQAFLHVGDDEIITQEEADAAGSEDADADGDRPEIGTPSAVEEQAIDAGVEPEPELVLTHELDMTLWQATRFVLHIRTNVALIIASGLGYFFLAGLETFAVLYFRDRFGLGQGLATLMFLVVALGAVAGVVVSGRVTDAMIKKGRTSARVIVGAVAYVGTAVAFIPGALSHVLVLSMPIFFVAAFCVGAANPPVDAARLDIVPARLWGRAEAVRTALRQVLQGFAPLLFGLVSEAFGGGRAGLSTGVDIKSAVVSGAAAHGLEMAFVLLSLPTLVGGGVLWLCRSVYLKEVVAAHRSDQNAMAAGE